MKIKTKLTFYFVASTLCILLFFACFVFQTASNQREKYFFENLQKEAITKANLFLDGKISPEILQTIYQNNRKTIPEVEVAIYDNNFQLLYHDDVTLDYVKETKQLLQQIQSEKSIQFYLNDYQVIGMYLSSSNRNLIVTAAAIDVSGYQELQSLWKYILAFCVISLVFLFWIGSYFSTKLLQPVQYIQSKTTEISAKNLHERIPNPIPNNELGQLITTINDLLQRLEQAFSLQKNILSYLAHELRTPLFTVKSEVEWLLKQPESFTEIKTSLPKITNDIHQLLHLIQSMLDYAKAQTDVSQIHFEKVEPVLCLLDAVQEVQKQYPQKNIQLHLSENEEIPEINGNKYLLTAAFRNLLENACKYGVDGNVQIKVTFEKQGLIITFSNKVASEFVWNPDWWNAFTKTTYQKSGYGLGMAIVQSIAQIHSAKIHTLVQNETLFIDWEFKF
jgi:signal transduction histidine kinase